MAKTHPFSQPVLGSRTSPYLQSKLVLLGSQQVFGQVPALVESLLGIEVNQSQVYRTCQMAAWVVDESLLHTPKAPLAACLRHASQTVYGMVDGSMLLTEQGWQEVKVGRVFSAQVRCPNQSNQPANEQLEWTIEASQYVAQRGNYEEFTSPFEQVLPPDSACRKVLISDGAQWIGPWLRQTYPEAVHILDYYHVKEKLALAAQAAPDPKSWLQQQEDHLFAGRQQAVEDALTDLPGLATADKLRTVEYLKTNRYRTRYDLYRKQGLMIGSGPVEAAHRTLLQVRMKRSGQRWSEPGCDNLIVLRTACQSGKFDLITDIFRLAA